ASTRPNLSLRGPLKQISINRFFGDKPTMVKSKAKAKPKVRAKATVKPASSQGSTADADLTSNNTNRSLRELVSPPAREGNGTTSNNSHFGTSNSLFSMPPTSASNAPDP